MKKSHLPLKARIDDRLTRDPTCLRMAEFSAISPECGTTFCLAGIILDESGVVMEYNPDGLAVGLEEGENVPSDRWVDFEMSLRVRRVPRSSVMIAARAREIWAAEYGDESAEMLPFYGANWGLDNREMDRVTAAQVLGILEIICGLAEVQSSVAA